MTDPIKMLGDDRPRLYHAPSSYYSMIARLALNEGGVAYEPVFVDIHVRMSQQLPDYVRLNPNMTVPTLVLPGRILDQSRNIAEFALDHVHDFGLGQSKVMNVIDFKSAERDAGGKPISTFPHPALGADDVLNAETKHWLDLHYSYPIEELTFGGFLSRNPLARVMIPKQLAASHRRLLARALAHPDLAEVYKARAAIFAERARIFDPEKALHLAEKRRAEAIDFMDQLERNLADGRAVMVPPTYGLADVVWTVFLARMEFTGLGAEIVKRPALARYWRAMQMRPSFAAADIWTRLQVLRLIGGILGIARHQERGVATG